MTPPTLIPTPQELLSLASYLISNPDLFINTTTVITSAIVAVTILLRVVLAFARVIGIVLDRTLQVIAPTVALVMMYFGLGAMALSTYILIRFHWAIPQTTEEQFRSGLGHLVIGVIGVLALLPWLRRRSLREWLLSNLIALAYWTYQVVVLTPPWFSFQNQRAFVLLAVGVLLGASATGTILALVWTSWRAARTMDPRYATPLVTRPSDPAPALDRDAA